MPAKSLNHAASLSTASWRRAYRCASLDAAPQEIKGGLVQTLTASTWISLIPSHAERAARSLCVRQCQKCQKGALRTSGTFGTPLVLRRSSDVVQGQHPPSRTEDALHLRDGPAIVGYVAQGERAHNRVERSVRER